MVREEGDVFPVEIVAWLGYPSGFARQGLEEEHAVKVFQLSGRQVD